MRCPPWSVALAGALIVTSCQGSENTPDPPLPAGPQVLLVDMAEYVFRYVPPAAGGRVLVRVENAGRVLHSLSVVPLDEDVPPIDQQLRSTERRPVAPFAGVGIVGPGAKTTFAVDLMPGTRYAFICFVTDAQGQLHALRGMASEFRIGGSGPRQPRVPASTAPSPPTS